MLRSKEKIAGIIGGMGPEATVDLMRRIIKNTPAEDDADHVRCIVDNNPKVPSRIKALIEGTGPSPGPVMADMARRLELWGADFLCIACNTAHNYYREVCDAVAVPVLNMVELAVQASLEAVPNARAVGILASPAVRTTRLYADELEARGLSAVYPDADAENQLLSLIKDIKRGNLGSRTMSGLTEVVNNLNSKGVQVVIAACTELGIVMNDEQYPVPVIDAAEVLAKTVVRKGKSI